VENVDVEKSLAVLGSDIAATKRAVGGGARIFIGSIGSIGCIGCIDGI
jgi:hypothetical protein